MKSVFSKLQKQLHSIGIDEVMDIKNRESEKNEPPQKPNPNKKWN